MVPSSVDAGSRLTVPWVLWPIVFPTPTRWRMAVDTERDASAAALETELKLIGSPAGLRAAFDAFGAGSETVRRLRSTYHDTANHDLWWRGLTLRVRDGVAGGEVTLKEEAGANIERREWTVPARGGGLNAYRLPA